MIVCVYLKDEGKTRVSIYIDRNIDTFILDNDNVFYIELFIFGFGFEILFLNSTFNFELV
jgi:hypothetical protein